MQCTGQAPDTLLPLLLEVGGEVGRGGGGGGAVHMEDTMMRRMTLVNIQRLRACLCDRLAATVVIAITD